MTPFLTHVLAVADQFKYLLLFIGTVVEGPVLMVACGFLLQFGVFQPIPMFVALASGDIVADVGWYYAGRFFLEPFMRRHGHFLSVTPEMIERVKKLFHTYHTRILFISKITIGFGMALGVLMVAGASRVPFRKYLIINIAGEIVFVMSMLLLGYLFGNAFTLIATGFRWLFIGAALVVTLAIIAGVSRYAKKRLLNP
jgi:membrane protein DedA with SNARE-associated domain